MNNSRGRRGGRSWRSSDWCRNGLNCWSECGWGAYGFWCGWKREKSWRWYWYWVVFRLAHPSLRGWRNCGRSRRRSCRWSICWGPGWGWCLIHHELSSSKPITTGIVFSWTPASHFPLHSSDECLEKQWYQQHE